MKYRERNKDSERSPAFMNQRAEKDHQASLWGQTSDSAKAFSSTAIFLQYLCING